MKIQSISDVITNSSSELFLVKSSLPFKEMKKVLNNHYDEHYSTDYKKAKEDGKEQYNFTSGMGGDHIIKKINDYIRKQYCFTADEFENADYLIDIDRYSFATIQWIKDNFEIVASDE